jgi:hypothetical protein
MENNLVGGKEENRYIQYRYFPNLENAVENGKIGTRQKP